MFTIKNITNEIIINKSRFITNIMYIEDESDALNKIKDIKSKYKDATHNCYAYIIDNIKRFNDDNEPSGTSGMPILDVLEKNKLNHVLCIVTRYFGGIKLGANGLIRAYSSSTKEAINKTIIQELVNGYMVNLSFSYDKEKIVNKIVNPTNKTYSDKIIYEALIDNNELNKLKELNIDIDIKKEILIRR